MVSPLALSRSKPLAIVRVERNSFLNNAVKIFWEYNDVTGAFLRIYTEGKIADRRFSVTVTKSDGSESKSEAIEPDKEGVLNLGSLGIFMEFSPTFKGTPDHWHLPKEWNVRVHVSATLNKIEENEIRNARELNRGRN